MLLDGVLQFGGFGWGANLMLKSWAGFAILPRSHDAVSHSRTSNGRVNVEIYAVNPAEPQLLIPEQIAACTYLIEHELALTRAVLDAIFTRYPKLQEIYGYDEDEAEERMPDIQSPLELRKLISLHSIHIHNRIKDELAYIEFCFRCTWDNEHLLHVLTHRDRAVNVEGEAVP